MGGQLLPPFSRAKEQEGASEQASTHTPMDDEDPYKMAMYQYMAQLHARPVVPKPARENRVFVLGSGGLTRDETPTRAPQAGPNNFDYQRMGDPDDTRQFDSGGSSATRTGQSKLSTSRFKSTPQETLQMIEYFTGAGRAENKERFRKFFAKFDANGDGVLQREEVKAAAAGICEGFLMEPPARAKVDELFRKTDKNGDGVLTIDEWKPLYGLLVRSALQQATACVEQQKAELAAMSNGSVLSNRAPAPPVAEVPSKGQGPPKKSKERKPPSKAKRPAIHACTVDTRGMACAFRFECLACGHEWFGMGSGVPKSNTCPGCSEELPVTDLGWG